MRKHRALMAAAIALTASGCYEGFDPLDPEVLAAVARGRGDAEGVERSGIYGGALTVIECDCDAVELLDLSLCSFLERAEELGISDAIELEVVQADGSLRVQPLGFDSLAMMDQPPLLPVLYGSLRADGRLTVAGVLQADALAVEGQVLSRVDGTLAAEDDEWRLVGTYQQRSLVELLVQPDMLDFGQGSDETAQSFDCREQLGLDLRWRLPLLVPVGGPG